MSLFTFYNQVTLLIAQLSELTLTKSISESKNMTSTLTKLSIRMIDGAADLPLYSKGPVDLKYQSKQDHMVLHHSPGSIQYYLHEHPVLGPTSKCTNER
jgi:hypothetical protein